MYDNGRLVWGQEPSGGDTQPPSRPANLAVTGHTSSTISLGWSASTDNVGVTSYRIFEGSAQVGTTATTAFTVTGLAAASTHSYTVVALDAAGNPSVASAAVTATTDPPAPDNEAPSAPSNLRATGQTAASISLGWTASMDNVGVTSYQILEGTTQVGTSATTAFTVIGLAASSTHMYTVRALDAAGNRSTASNAVTATTSAPGTTGGLKAQYFAADTTVGDNQVKPHLNLVNVGTSTVALSTVTVRYWYTVDGSRPQAFWCDWTPRGCDNVTGKFVAISPRSGADTYLEVGFSAAMGSLAPGQSTGEIMARFNKDNWSNFGEADDYSFDPTKLSFADWDRVTVYQNGTLIWGSEPPVAVGAVEIEPRSADGADGADEAGADEAGARSGGCSTGRSGMPLGLVIVVVGILLRRRR
ncbi:MAG: cellulose binding domain-containing protein, partial [Solirubrobacteraceae bacterium]